MKTEWAHKKLIDLADYYNGMAFKPSDWVESGTKIIRIEQLNNPLGNYDYYQGSYPEINAIHNEDLIFSWSATLKVAIWKWGEGVLNQHLFKVVPFENVDKYFLYYLLDYNMPKLGESSHGSTMKHIKRKELETYSVKIPTTLSAQRRIAAILASADKVIAATQKTIAKYKQIKQGMMEDLLNEQCTMNNVQWKKVRLGEGCNRMCNGMTYDIDEKEGYLVTRIETISDGYIDYNRVGHTKELPKEDYKLLKGDILFSHINSVKHIGKVAYFDGEELLYHGMNLLLLRANNEINSKFLYYLLSSETVRQRMRTLAKSAVNQASINTTELQKFSFFIPDLTEQRRIAAILSGIDAKIAAEEKVLQKYEKVKKGLMERLLNEQ